MLTFYYNFFFFNDTATTEIYTLSLHDALPIYLSGAELKVLLYILRHTFCVGAADEIMPMARLRSEEHTSELQSRPHLVCRLLLEKKKNFSYLTSYVSAIETTMTTRLLSEPHDH